jgi:hypothetical protein
VNIHASQQEGRESCAEKQDLAVSKFSAGGESEDERIIYASPLPCVHVEAVEIHMDCYQHKCTESMASHTQQHCQILEHEIYQQPLNQLAGFDLI